MLLTGCHEPHVNGKVRKLTETFRSSFFAVNRRPAVVAPFVVRGEGHLLDAHDIEKLCPSKSDNFSIQTPKPMLACLNADKWKGKVCESTVRS